MLDVIYPDARQDNCKLIATEASQNIFRAQAEFEAMAEGFEECVASLMPKSVIDRLELIQIQVQDGADAAVPNT